MSKRKRVFDPDPDSREIRIRNVPSMIYHQLALCAKKYQISHNELYLDILEKYIDDQLKPKRRRGRPPKSKKESESEFVPIDPDKRPFYHAGRMLDKMIYTKPGEDENEGKNENNKNGDG